MVRLRDLQSGMIFKKGKKRRELTLASVFILTFVWIWPVECFLQRPQTGDLMFVGDDSARYKGRVSIYIDPKDSTEGWGTINGKGISIVEGNVICRQLGYTKAKEAYNADTHNGMNKYTINETGFPVWIEESGLHCDSENLLHILRCISGWRDISRHPLSLDHSSDFIVVCDQESISTEHYDKQVFINSTEGSFNYSSAGEILLYLDKMPHWGTVGIGKETNNPFSVNGANAVCRQLGYTSAAYFAKGHRSIDVTWFKGGEKCHSPVNCFSCCFEYPKDYCHDCHLDDTVYNYSMHI